MAELKAWKTHFDERQLKEIEFCKMYAEHFAHGTDGHNVKLIVAKMAQLLDSGLVPVIVPRPHISGKVDNDGNS